MRQTDAKARRSRQTQQHVMQCRSQKVGQKNVPLALIPLVCAMSLALVVLLLPAPMTPIVSAHAVLVRSDPAVGARLGTPPAQVRVWFDDTLIAATSHVIVQNAGGQEVDRRSSVVNHANPHEMSVALPPLPPGTYTVTWVAQSTDDGHVTTGSFAFSISGANGAVPPVTPGSQVPGNASLINNITVDGPTVLQTMAVWLALLLMTVWLGGLFWETWILPPGATHDLAVSAISLLAARRFRRWLPYLLIALLCTNGLIVFGQEAELAGNWSVAFAPSLIQALLFGSRFGLFWWMRQITLLVALSLTLTGTRRQWSRWRSASSSVTDASSVQVSEQIPSYWWKNALNGVYSMMHLPTSCIAGWRRLTWPGRLELGLGGVFLVAYAFSGHAAAVPDSTLGFAVSVDVLHLLGDVIWVGGLLYITTMIVPLLRRFDMRQRAHVLASGLPSFSVFAVLSVIILSLTGPLNATVHVTSWQQLATTLYGWTLIIKIELFLLMVAISLYHAGYLRPHLARELNRLANDTGMEPEQIPIEAREVAAHAALRPLSTLLEARNEGTLPATQQYHEYISARAQRLTERLEGWLRREAMLGVAVLLCVALLGAFAGTLVP